MSNQSTTRKPHRKTWSKSVGPYGATIRVAERTPGGSLYLLWVDRNRKQQKRSLGHRDRQAALAAAMTLSQRLLERRDQVERRKVRVGELFDIFAGEGLQGRSKNHREGTIRSLRLWLRFLGNDRLAEGLSPVDVDRFIRARKTGSLGGSARSDLVSDTTVWHDIVSLKRLLNFGVEYRDPSSGLPLLPYNPLRGVRAKKSMSPAQPVATEETYLMLRTAGSAIDWRLPLALDVAYHTGHRIGAILKLQWVDVDLEPTPDAPFGSIRWKAEFDKIGNEHRTPIASALAERLQDASNAQPNGGWLFPSPTDPATPLDRHLASRWLRKAEALAGLPHERGFGWHALRRGWASARRGLPDVDVATAGGWKDVSTMKRSYQKADAAGVLRAVIGVTGGVAAA